MQTFSPLRVLFDHPDYSSRLDFVPRKLKIGLPKVSASYDAAHSCTSTICDPLINLRWAFFSVVVNAWQDVVIIIKKFELKSF